jgi:hypothetical protein
MSKRGPTFDSIRKDRQASEAYSDEAIKELADAAAPAPQAEGTWPPKITVSHGAPPGVASPFEGAAPAETARPMPWEDFKKILAEEERRETAGEMTAERCEVTGNPVGTDTWMTDCACECAPCQKLVKALNDAHAKQRVEQEERRVSAIWVDVANAKLRQIADLERERDALIDKLDRCNCGLDPKNDQFAPPWGHAPTCNYRVGLADKLLKMSSELREMREALGHLRWKNHIYAPTSCDACAKAERLLPNQCRRHCFERWIIENEVEGHGG